MRKILLLLSIVILQKVQAQNFTPGNLVIYRVGTGAAALSNASTAVFLDEYSPTGTLVQSLPMPVVASGGNFPLTASGTASSEGLLTRSTDGNFLVMVGYSAAPGVGSIAGTTGATTPRVVGIVDFQKAINTTTVLADYASGNNPRSAASTDGSAVWVTGGAGGIRYTTKGSTTSTQLNTTVTNIRGVSIYNNQLYISASTGSLRLGTVGTGTPTTTGQTIANLPGFPTTGSPYQFVFFDVDATVAGVDVLYVADDGAGIQKYSLVAGNWVFNNTVGVAADMFRGLTGSISGTTVTLYGVRKANEFVSVTDAAGYNANNSGTITSLATAGTNTAFRGIAFVPNGGVAPPVNNLSLTFTPVAASSPLAPPSVTTTLSDPTDPLKNNGVLVDVKDNNVAIPAADYTLAATSNNTTVVPTANVAITKADGQATVKVTAAAAGYATITLTLTKGSLTKTLTLNVAASAGAGMPSVTRFHSGSADASAAIAIDDTYMIVADDEMNKLAVYNRNASGLPVTTFDYSTLLNLTDLSGGQPREVDVEAAVRSLTTANRIYWLGSHSNSATSFNARPNRNRLFALTATGTGSATTFGYTGRYDNLRQDLITWGDAAGYNFTAAAAAGKDPKQIDGFNLEGLTIAPDNTTAYIAFRAPLVPTANRTNAVIAPLLNFESWFNNGSPVGSPTFGAPIELALGGRGFRDMIRLTSGSYIILAGNYDDLPLNPAVFTWNGNAATAPVQITTFNLTDLNPEAAMEVQSGGTVQADRLQVLSDNGSVVYYGDGVEAKDLTQNNFKKFRSDVLITGTGAALPVTFKSFTVDRSSYTSVLKWETGVSAAGVNFTVERSTNGADFTAIGTVAGFGARIEYGFADAAIAAGKIYYRIAITDAAGRTVYSAIRIVNVGGNSTVQVYPNPVSGGAFTIATSATGLKYVALFNAAGSKVKELSFTTSAADVSTSGLPKGSYTVVVSTKEKLVAAKTIAVQ